MKTPYDSDTNSVNIDIIKSKMGTLKSALNRYDSQGRDRFDLPQLQRFLDSYMKNGNKFDKVLAQKIFSLSDLDHDGKLTTEEFVKTYLQIEDEIKTHSKDLHNKYTIETQHKESNYKLMLANRDERLNAEGLCEDAKVEIEIADIEFLRNTRLELSNVSIRMSIGEMSQQTRSLNFKPTGMNKLTWHESFEL
jgi:hypothetical protein